MIDGLHRDHIDRSSSPSDFTFPTGFHYLPGYLSMPSQLAFLSDVRKVLDEAPLFEQAMPRTGAPLSVRIATPASSAGSRTARADTAIRRRTRLPSNGGRRFPSGSCGFGRI
jgi:alkylated DNA repair dioxygenase AlkB